MKKAAGLDTKDKPCEHGYQDAVGLNGEEAFLLEVSMPNRQAEDRWRAPEIGLAREI